MVDEQLKRLQAFAESGAIGAYDADDLHGDVRYVLAERAGLHATLEKTYGPLEGRGVPGLLWRAAEVLDVYAGKDSRSILAENLRAAAIDICRVTGLRCDTCQQPRPILPFNDKNICQDCLRVVWRTPAAQERAI